MVSRSSTVIALARIRLLPMALAEVIVDPGLPAGQAAAVDRRVDQQRGDALGRRAGVVKGMPVGIAEVALVDQRAVAYDQHAAAVRRLAVGDGLFQRRERGQVPARGLGVGDVPAVVQRRRRGGGRGMDDRRSEDEQGAQQERKARHGGTPEGSDPSTAPAPRLKCLMSR